MNWNGNSQDSNMEIATGMFVARSLDEVRFWSRIMKEHSLDSQFTMSLTSR